MPSVKYTFKNCSWTYGCQGEGWGERRVREFGTDTYTLLFLKWITNNYCVVQRTLINVKWQPGWEGSLGEKGYMYMYGWVPLLSTRNYHNIVNWLYLNTKLKKNKKEAKQLFSIILEKSVNSRIKDILFNSEMDFCAFYIAFIVFLLELHAPSPASAFPILLKCSFTEIFV